MDPECICKRMLTVLAAWREIKKQIDAVNDTSKANVTEKDMGSELNRGDNSL